MNNFMEELFWNFPYETRRKLFKLLRKNNFMNLMKMRANVPEKLFEPTFEPFVRNKCIFVHIPKAAGISIGYSLFGRHTGNHRTIKEYQIIFSKEEFDSFFKFTFVRNPWDRLASAYMFMKKGGRNSFDAEWAEKYLTQFNDFEDFVLNWVNTDNINLGAHIKPQYKFVTTNNIKKVDVDFVGYFETIENDYEYIRQQLGFGSKLEVKNKTTDKRNDFREYYSDKMIQIVEDAYREDIELFGYNFDNSSIKQISNP